jgi:hypothetical protein
MREPDPAERDLFMQCLAPLRAICRPALDRDQVLGYFNALADLPPEAVFVAATEIAGSRQYTNWPMPGEIRAKAVVAMSPQLTAGEAWALAQRTAQRMVDESLSFKVWNGQRIGTVEWNQQLLDALPIAVAAAFRVFGPRAIRESTTAFAQFRDEYEKQVTILRRPIMLPAPAKALLSGLMAKSDLVKKLQGPV